MKAVRKLGWLEGPTPVARRMLPFEHSVLAESLYEGLPILPPDLVHAIYLQATVGCASDGCTHCTLYRDRGHRHRSLEEFRKHVTKVAEVLGPRTEGRDSLFLGDADALSLPTEVLASMIRAAREAFPGRRVYAFSNPILGRQKTIEDCKALKTAGLWRVTVELDTADFILSSLLRKPSTIADPFVAIQKLKASGIQVGLTVQVGLGGPQNESRHVSGTVEYILGQNLSRGDVVYLLPYEIDPASSFSAWAAMEEGRVSSEEEIRRQSKLFRERLGAGLAGRGVRIIEAGYCWLK